MSMPNIPDITPEIDLTFEQATNLLLTSVAMEEISLSKLMDAETNKINFVLDEYKTSKGTVADILAVNASVNATIINMIKLQMLLQFKLENIERLIHIEPQCKPCPPPKCNKHCCLFYGSAKGCIVHKCDRLCGGEAQLTASMLANSSDADKVLEYTASTECIQLYLQVLYCDILTVCPIDCVPGKAMAKGKATCTKSKKNCEPTTECVDFCLTVWDRPLCKKGFHMLITSACKDFCHDSGFILTQDSLSTLVIRYT